jgi:hypothetical protein
MAQSFGQGRKQLSVKAGPADQYTAEEIAEKLHLPKPDMTSAVVANDATVLPPPLDAPPPTAPSPTAPGKPGVVLSRQPTTRPVGAQVRFGQPPTAAPPIAGQPLPTLPEERKGHIIFQPIRK